MKFDMDFISALYSRAGISYPDKYREAMISGSGSCMAIQFRFDGRNRIALNVMAGTERIRNTRQVTEYYLEHFWGRPDTEYSSLLIARIFAMLVEDYFKTCDTELQKEPREEPQEESQG